MQQRRRAGRTRGAAVLALVLAMAAWIVAAEEPETGSAGPTINRFGDVIGIEFGVLEEGEDDHLVLWAVWQDSDGSPAVRVLAIPWLE